MSDLPQGWELKKGSEVFDIVRGVSYDKQYVSSEPFDDAIAILRANNIQSNGIVQNDLVYVPKRYVSSNQLIQTGDIIIATSSGSRDVVGKTALANTTHNNLSFGAFCSVARPKPLCLDKWLAYFTQSRLYRDYVEQVALGININNFRTRDLASMTIPLPPLEEQRRIVAKLDVLLGRNKAGRHELSAAAQLIKRQRQAVLAQAFTGKLTADVVVSATASDFLSLIPPTKSTLKKKTANLIENTITPPFDIPSNWQWTNIGSVFEVVIGGTPSRQKPEFWDGDIPWVSSGEVAFTRIKNTRQSITQEGIINSSAKLLPIGTVLLGMIGEGKTRGQAAILDIPATSNQNIAAILCSQTPIPSEWLYYWLQASYSVTRGDGVGGVQPALNSDRVRQLLIPIAPLEEQREIVRRIEAAFARIDEGEQAVKQAFTLAERLEQATLAKAFRGEL
jgi:type I restriction enzyme S subunit